MLQPPEHVSSTSHTSLTSTGLTNTARSQAHRKAARVGKPGAATDSKGFCQMESQDFCQLPLCRLLSARYQPGHLGKQELLGQNP